MSAYKTFEFQVGGHGKIICSKEKGRLLKPMIPRELHFYKTIHAASFPDHLHWLREAAPIFHGQSHIGIPGAPSYIELGDMTAPFQAPCILDAKLGTRHYDDDASPEKAARTIARSRATTSFATGVRITGMQVLKYVAEPDTKREKRGWKYERCEKLQGRSLREQELLPAMGWFLSNNENVRRDVVSHLLKRLTALAEKIDVQNRFFFYSTSLLVIYEGDVDASCPTRFDARLVDFAHTVNSKGYCDKGCAKGLRTIIQLLGRLSEIDGPVRLPGENKYGRKKDIKNP